MEYKNEHQRRMAILEASLPYVSPGNRHAFELLLQADSLIQLANHAGDSDLEAAEDTGDAVPFRPNPQEMLLNIQKFLTPRESDIVQTILNFMNAQKFTQKSLETIQNLFRFCTFTVRKHRGKYRLFRCFLFHYDKPPSDAFPAD